MFTSFSSAGSGFLHAAGSIAVGSNGAKKKALSPNTYMQGYFAITDHDLFPKSFGLISRYLPEVPLLSEEIDCNIADYALYGFEKLNVDGSEKTNDVHLNYYIHGFQLTCQP